MQTPFRGSSGDCWAMGESLAQTIDVQQLLLPLVSNNLSDSSLYRFERRKFSHTSLKSLVEFSCFNSQSTPCKL
jgi:hypothetical protein